MSEKCKAAVVFGDDHGDNSCTFHCGLDESHEGDHKEVGSMYESWPYELTWKGDMREKPPTVCPQCDSTDLAPDEDLEDWRRCRSCGAKVDPLPYAYGKEPDEAEK